jgi:ParB family chromosome partitioning protein
MTDKPKISEPKIQRLDIALIEVNQDERLRGIAETGVQSLIASIEELGVIKDAIHVRKKRRADGESLVLMAGGHRLEAAKRLGWETIPARIWSDVTDDFATLMEIDDNLAGGDLSNLELSVFLAERKRVYERLHPEAKAGAFRGNQYTDKVANEIISFTKSVAEKRELSSRHIENFVRIGNALSRREVANLSASEQPLKFKDLMALAKISEPIVRADVVGRLASGNVKSVAAALDILQPSKGKPKATPDEQSLMQMVTAWKRGTMAAKRQFLADYGEEIAEIIASNPAAKGA